MTYRLSIVLADDHALVREGLKHLLLTFKNVQVVGEAGDGFEAIRKADELKPDIMILDISMPQLRGIEAIKEIKRCSPETKVLILSMYKNSEYIRQTLQYGASGYILKESASDELRKAISYLAEDQVYLSPAISKTVVASWLNESKKPRNDRAPLTKREQEVLKLLAEGNTNRQVAEKLYISIKTAETHRAHISEKLQMKSLADLVKYAIQERYIELDKTLPEKS